MGIYKIREIRAWDPREREKKLADLRAELIRLRTNPTMLENTSQIREIRRTIARILTVIREEQLKKSK
ncbi:MAG: 50S ribosomal protein L29 [Candidatus Odinarchaeota archaeon]|nr:50S ribosomal protein L29 [Candidatus Odinarchaeota archaeon]